MAKKTDNQSNKVSKEVLFQNFFNTAIEVLDKFESCFEVTGVCDQFFGNTRTGPYDSFESDKHRLLAENKVRASRAWMTLSSLYDYAVDGVAGDADPTDIVIDGAEILSFITTENFHPMAEWEMIVARGDGRYCLDDGQDVYIEKLALLAEVDIRTVRNAISSGELSAEKRISAFPAGIYIDNASAHRWLQSRRGYKPTVFHGEASKNINDVVSPSGFGAFLSARREDLGLNTGDGKLLPLCPGIDANALAAIESGVFDLPLSAVNPLADFYQVDRKAFLNCVMRVFFSDYLATIRQSLSDE